MNKIYITSDLHLGHDKDFVVAERGFTTVFEHDAAIKNNWNGLIDEEDEVYLPQPSETIRKITFRLHSPCILRRQERSLQRIGHR